MTRQWPKDEVGNNNKPHSKSSNDSDSESSVCSHVSYSSSSGDTLESTSTTSSAFVTQRRTFFPRFGASGSCPVGTTRVITASTPEGFPRLGAVDTLPLDPNLYHLALGSPSKFEPFDDMDVNEEPLPANLPAKSRDSHPNRHHSSSERKKNHPKQRSSHSLRREESYESADENLDPNRREHLGNLHDSRQRHRDQEYQERYQPASPTNMGSGSRNKRVATQAAGSSTSKRRKNELPSTTAANRRKSGRNKVDNDDDSLDPQDPAFDPNLEDSYDSDGEVTEVLQKLGPKERKVLQQKLASCNSKQKELQVEVQVAAARAGAQLQMQSKETVEVVEKCVKTWLWRTCKIVTTIPDLEAATRFVFSKVVGELNARNFTEQEKANWVHTYQSVVSGALCTRRNYVQQELRKAALAYGSGEKDSDEPAVVDDDDATTTSGSKADDDNGEEEEEKAPAALAPLVPRDLFTPEMMLKCATR